MIRVSLALALIGAVAVVSAQRPAPGSASRAPRPTFAVASVKPQARPTTLDALIAWPRVQPGGRLAGTHSTVERLITFAYDVKAFQLIGAPGWTREEYFDVDARAAVPVPIRELRLMAQSLLEDRFALVTHTEQREIRYHALVLARPDRRPGPNLHSVAEEACVGRTIVEVHLEKFPEARKRGGAANPGGGTIAGACHDLGVLAEAITQTLGTLVIDRTNLSGLWVYDAPYLGGRPVVNSPRLGALLPVETVPGPPPYTVALEQQLGLKLESAFGPVDVLVIDSVQRPTPD